MDKKLILAVAGSGKTSLVIERLSENDRALLITYTDNNARHLENRVLKKFGHVPSNIRVYTYFSFLHAFAFKPLMSGRTKARGIRWKPPPAQTMKMSRGRREFYIDTQGRLYHNRIAKLLQQYEHFPEINERLAKYFDTLYIDEVQDFAGHDFNLLLSICQAELDIMAVGDFFQHTFDTSRDGSVNRNLHNDFLKYRKRLTDVGLEEDQETLSHSYRCSPSVCSFVRENLGISIHSHRKDDTTIQLINDPDQAKDLFAASSTVKLFYSEHHNYPCFSQNWGRSKGQDMYEDVCVVLGKNQWKALNNGELSDLTPQTRNKLYVACTRARGDLMFVKAEHFKSLKAPT